MRPDIRHSLVLVAIVSALGLSGSVHAQLEPTPVVVPELEPTALPSVMAQFTTAIENREPVDQVTFVSNDVKTIYFYSDLRGFEGQTVTHRWLHDGETRAEVEFEVGGPRWRVWSSKDLLEDWIGDWTVEIVSAAGEVVAAETFTYSAPDA
jgi:hypothetical protein